MCVCVVYIRYVCARVCSNVVFVGIVEGEDVVHIAHTVHVLCFVDVVDIVDTVDDHM